VIVKRNKLSKGDALIEVIPLAGFNAQLAYKVPSFLAGQIRKGHLVRIPIRNKSELGVVVQLSSDQIISNEKIKYVLELVQSEPVLTEDLHALLKWCSSYYTASFESILEAMIPSFIRKGMGAKKIRTLEIAKNFDVDLVEPLLKKAPKQAKLLKFMMTQKFALPKAIVIKRLKISSSVCDGLIKKGYLLEAFKEEKREAYMDTLAQESNEVLAKAHQLTEEQASITEKLHQSIEKKAFSVEVVHGVTGSGKTEVYLRAIASVVNRGGGVVFLVPEIALAPQTVGRVRNRLEAIGVKTVVWHSHLSDGERHDAWSSLVKGEASVVVGARSAIFAPVKNLELIIVDEEHEPSYKQEDTPRYHGRDVAVYRAFINNAVCILGSATPSLETFYNTTLGKYKLHKMYNRVDNRELPKVHIVDMRKEGKMGDGSGPISSLLADKMLDRFEKKEQTILFLNRRGFASNFLCQECGHVATCEHCSIPMTVHRTDWTLKCHLCSLSYKMPKVCPKCHNTSVLAKGFGTQRIEDIVQKIVPRAKIVRMDADAMTKKNLFRSILNDFRIGKIDILVGTQMIAKGLDFPNVTLVGLVDADRSLHVEDFRASERTFQLIVQVSGRSGRGDRAGEVVVQTCTPHASPILYARQTDFQGFLEETLGQRKEFNYPPYRHLIRHLFSGKNPDKVLFFMNQWLKA
jgi:primosomal protein N' (replication factor Y)